MLKLFKEWRARRNEAYAKRMASAPLNRAPAAPGKLVGRCFARPLSILSEQQLVEEKKMTEEEIDGLKGSVRDVESFEGSR